MSRVLTQRRDRHRGDRHDETTELRFVIWESSDCDVSLEDGDHYRHTNVDVSEFEGTLELHVQEYTQFESIGQDVGHTEPADAGDNATLDDEHIADEEGATDGGEPSAGGGSVPTDVEGMLADARRLVELIERCGVAMEENEVVVAASIDRDLMEPDRTKDVLEYAVSEKGLIMETGDGYTPV